MPHSTIPYRPRPGQARAHALIDAKRFTVFPCHRRWGKTVAAVNEGIKQALHCPLPNPHITYIAPTRKQAKKVAWEYLLMFAKPIIAGRERLLVNRSELTVTLPRGANDKASIQLMGANDPDNEVGQYFDYAILDEYSVMSPRMWSQIVRPSLSDRKGRATFIGTPRGRNSFYDMFEQAGDDAEWGRMLIRASESGVLDEAELRSARRTMTPAEYKQEYECSWTAAIRGAFYADQIAKAEEDGRITTVPYERGLPVVTSWDLGIRNSVIGFWQIAGTQVRCIDCWWEDGESLERLVRRVMERPFQYAKHIMPHDIGVQEFGTGKTRVQTVRDLGMDFVVCPTVSEADGINAVELMLDRVAWDRDSCKELLEAMTQFRAEYDEIKRNYKTKPIEDWTNHFADMVRYFAVQNGGQQMNLTQWDQPIRYGGNAALA